MDHLDPKRLGFVIYLLLRMHQFQKYHLLKVDLMVRYLLQFNLGLPENKLMCVKYQWKEGFDFFKQ